MLPRKIIIDADTGNEIDDLYAIARALHAPELEVLGLTACHYSAHDDAPADSADESHRLNIELLKCAGRSDIPALPGGNHWMGKAWGGYEPADSPAVQHIIKTARALPDGERLIVAVQGAMTNIASAVRIAPDLIKRLEIHVLAAQYDASTGVWNKNEFNIRNDLNAADYLLNTEGLELHIMTATASKGLLFNREKTFAQLSSKKPIEAMLLQRWSDFAPDSSEWIMWDLALIEAIINPQLATQITGTTPPENTQRPVSIYTAIDAVKMETVFFETLRTILGLV